MNQLTQLLAQDFIKFSCHEYFKTYIYIYIYIYLFIYLFIYLYIYLFVYLFIYLVSYLSHAKLCDISYCKRVPNSWCSHYRDSQILYFSLKSNVWPQSSCVNLVLGSPLFSCMVQFFFFP